VLNFAVLST